MPSYLRSFCALSHGRASCDLSGATTHCIRLMHRLPWQSIPEIRRDTSKVMYAIIAQLQRWGVDFRMTPQPVHLESRVTEVTGEAQRLLGESDSRQDEFGELRRNRTMSLHRQETLGSGPWHSVLRSGAVTAPAFWQMKTGEPFHG